MADTELFTRKKVITEAVDRAMLMLEPLKRGQVAPWEGLESAAGFNRTSPHWASFRLRLLRDFRRKTGIVLWPMHGEGWKLLTIDEQIRWRNQKRMKRAARQLRRNTIELQAISNTEMSTRQLMERQWRAEASHREMKSVRKAAKSYETPSQGTKSSQPRDRTG